MLGGMLQRKEMCITVKLIWAAHLQKGDQDRRENLRRHGMWSIPGILYSGLFAITFVSLFLGVFNMIKDAGLDDAGLDVAIAVLDSIALGSVVLAAVKPGWVDLPQIRDESGMLSLTAVALLALVFAYISLSRIMREDISRGLEVFFTVVSALDLIVIYFK